ncbi:HAD hydrolase [Sanghuangporus baumii]|uniref:HAD hydrolase n=1 Tax=Sanghuangporus baumii TaxID=108892 RepID=A0A9Q5HVJ5_SANBA|nr:HAD hydrolase [Sanghuangporus baumii]
MIGFRLTTCSPPSVIMALAFRYSALPRLPSRTFPKGISYRRRWNSQVSRFTRDLLQRRPPLTFAFDIDGVLIRGQHVLPQAKRALKFLDGGNELGIKIPYILITNGGGTSETIRCQRLSNLLGVENKISTNQYMQAHTIYKTVAHEYADKPVLVLGGRPGAIPRVAEEYDTVLLLVVRTDMQQSRPGFDPTTRFAAIFVFHDPRNWAFDAQISLDIVCNHGYVLPASMRPTTEAWSMQPEEPSSVKLYFCNPDLLWGSDYPTPRIGQGAFRVAFQSVYQSLMGKTYPYVQYGKPTKATYAFAEQLLRKRLQEVLQEGSSGKKGDVDGEMDHTPNVYMVGDNPESDIAGANAKGWQSVLVKTGVYDPARGPPAHQPTHIADDVEQAVRWAINREFSRIQ